MILTILTVDSLALFKILYQLLKMNKKSDKNSLFTSDEYSWHDTVSPVKRVQYGDYDTMISGCENISPAPKNYLQKHKCE
jgi:hypothetical protein